jgi:hypothetical protein
MLACLLACLMQGVRPPSPQPQTVAHREERQRQQQRQQRQQKQQDKPYGGGDDEVNIKGLPTRVSTAH